MFLKNAWYNAGWDYMVGQSKDALVARQIAGERVVLYRKPNGEVVALEDRCPHRQAAMSLGRKEGDDIRCMYHGMKFSSDGKCNEIPGQEKISDKACIRAFPVIEKDNWIWLWFGEPDQADQDLIPFSIGYDDPAWNMKTSSLRVDANYRLEVANLADLSHLSWVHDKTIAGTDKYAFIKPKYTLLQHGLSTKYWVKNIPVPATLKHLFPEGMMVDVFFEITHTLPCTWILNFKVFTAGSDVDGPSNGDLLLDTYTCQAVTPRDAESVDYYFAWGARSDHEFPGLSDLLLETLNLAFAEDKAVLEAQQIRMSEKPEFQMVDIIHDAGPGKMLWLLDKHLKAEKEL